MNRFALLGLSLFSLASLQGCTLAGVATGAGAAVGVAAAQEGGLSQAGRDLAIRAEINDLWFKHDLKMFAKLDMTVTQGRVLLTGVVQNPEHRVEAVRLAWQPKGVQQVINEIQVTDSEGITGYAKDTWITSRIRAAITFDRDVQSINYSIDTVQGIVYLMGVAQSQAELNRVIEIARTIKNVKQVVSYMKIAGVAVQDAVPTQQGTNYQNDAVVASEPYVPEDSSSEGAGSQGPTPLTAPDWGAEPEGSSTIETEELLWDERQ